MSSLRGYGPVHRGHQALGEAAGAELAHQPALDGLRGVAVAGVLVFHADLGWLPGGFLGVSTFFTLSGFLITTLLVQVHQSRDRLGLRRFWARRARRLFPAATLTLAGAGIFGALVATPSQLADLRLDVLAALAYIANWRFILADQSYADLFSAPSPVLHFWSLAIEEQFYVIYPLLLMGLVRITGRSRRRTGAVLFIGALLSTGWMAVLRASGGSLDRAYYGTDTRAAELLVGAVLGVMLLGRHVIERADLRRCASWAGTASLAALLVLYATVDLEDGWLYRGGFLLVAVLGAVTILGALQPGAPVRRVLGVRPLRGLGLISYAVYLFHWPIFLALEQGPGITGGRLLVVGSAATLVLGGVSYRYLEQPIRRGRLLRGNARVVAIPAAALGVLALTVVVTVDPPEDPLALLAQAEAAAAMPRPPPEPLAGVDRPLRVLVVGDRLATPLVEGLRGKDGDPLRLEVSDATAAECGHSPETPAPDGSAPACDDLAASWLGGVAEHDPEVVLLMLGATASGELRSAFGADGPPADDAEYTAWMHDEFAHLIAGLSEDGASVVIAEFPHPLRVDHQPDAPEPIRTTASALRSAALADPTVTFVPADDLPTYPAIQQGVQETDVHDWSDSTATALLDPIREAAATSAESVAPRVMVVGDSVGWFIGHGLERWALDTGSLHAWNTATVGCGLARGGDLLLYDGVEPSRPECDDWAQRWSRQVDEFDPDVVVVLTGLWDFTDRRLPSWEGFHHIGEAAYDRWLLSEYEDAVGVLSSSGAEVVWLTFPCHSERILPGPLAENPALETERLEHYNAVLLPELSRRQPEIRILDLFGQVCPDGSLTQNLGGFDNARPDGVHFRAEVAYWVAEWMGPQLLEAP